MTIIPLTGNDHNEWHQSVIRTARSLSPLLDGGLFLYTQTNAQLTAILYNIDPQTGLSLGAAAPPHPGQHYPNTALTQAAHKYALDIYVDYKKGMVELTAKISDSLNAAEKQTLSIANGHTNYNDLTLLQIMTSAATHLAVYTAENHANIEAILGTQWDPIMVTFDVHVARFVRAAEIARRNGQAFSQINLIQLFMATLLHLGAEITAVHQFWNSANPNAAIRTLDSLTLFMMNHMRNNRPTVHTLGRAAVAAESTEPTDTALAAKSSDADLLVKLLNKVLHKVDKIDGCVCSGGGEKKSTTDLYCWTHGKGSHSGKDCKHKATGHIDTASLSNKQSGSTREKK